jgi:hypothetical protein
VENGIRDSFHPVVKPSLSGRKLNQINHLGWWSTLTGQCTALALSLNRWSEVLTGIHPG